MKRHARRMLSAVTLAGLTFALAAQAAFTGAGDTDVRFQAVGPAGLTIDGEGTGLTVSEEGGKVKMVAALTGLKTGMALRDKHLKNYLHVDQHPQATLVVDRGSLKLPGDNEVVESTATGQFTLNGQTQAVPFTYRAKRTGSDFHVQGLATNTQAKHDLKLCKLGDTICFGYTVDLKDKFKLRQE